MHNYDVIVIGDGILGVSTVFALIQKDPSLSIGLVGNRNNSCGATLAAGAMLGCFGEVTRETLGSQYSKAKFEMGLRATKIWPKWLEQINDSLPKNKQCRLNLGTSVILNSKSGKLDSDNFDAIIAALEINSEPYDRINPFEISGLNPVEDSRPIKAVHIPNEGFLNPLELLSSFDFLFEQNSKIKLISDKVCDFNLSGDAIHFVQTESGLKLQANRYLIAAGANSQELLDKIPRLGKLIPKIIFGAGCSLLVEKRDNAKINHVIRTPNRAFACGLHVLPRGTEALYIGATNMPTTISEHLPRMGHLHFLMQCAIEQINHYLHEAKVLKCIAGNRPISLDTFPLIGGTSINNLWLLTATYRDGLHQSPVLATIMAKQILGKLPSFDNIFKPERPFIQSITYEQALSDGIDHYMATAYEQSMVLPRVGWNSMVKELIAERIKKIYNDLGFVIPTDLLLLFDTDYEKGLSLLEKNINISGKEKSLGSA
jgi:glycine oxidase